MHCKMKEGIVFKRSQQLMDLLGLPHFPLFIFLRKWRDLGNLINVVSLLCCWKSNHQNMKASEYWEKRALGLHLAFYDSSCYRNMVPC